MTIKIKQVYRYYLLHLTKYKRNKHFSRNIFRRGIFRIILTLTYYKTHVNAITSKVIGRIFVRFLLIDGVTPEEGLGVFCYGFTRAKKPIPTDLALVLFPCLSLY